MVLGYVFDGTVITDVSSLGDFCARCETRAEYEAWEQKVRQRVEDRYGVGPGAARVKLVDLFRDIEAHRRSSTRQ